MPELETCTFTFMHFPVGELPVVKNQFLKHFFLIKYYIITVLKKLKHFGQYFKKSKMDFHEEIDHG